MRAADIVLGLDTSLTAEATATGLIAPHGLDLAGLQLPIAWNDPQFVPFDYGYFAFVYDKTKLGQPADELRGTRPRVAQDRHRGSAHQYARARASALGQGALWRSMPARCGSACDRIS